MPPHRTSEVATPLQQSAAVPVAVLEHGQLRQQPVPGDSRSFPGQPGYAGTTTPIRANRSLSDDRGKVLSSMSSFHHPGEEEDEDGEPLLKSAWMSIVGAAGKFLGRAQERHHWSDARVGMMNRLLSKNKSGSAASFHVDEEGGSRTNLLRPVSISRGSMSTAAHLEQEASNNSMPRVSGQVSTSAATRAGTDWADSASYASGAQYREFRSTRDRESSDRSLPHLHSGGSHVVSSGQNASSSQLPSVRFHPGELPSPSWAAGPGVAARPSADQGFEGLEMREGRRLAVDIMKRHQLDEARQSLSGSNSTRNSIPLMPPLGRNNSANLLQNGEVPEDHLHGLLQKLRARRLGQEAAVAAAELGVGPIIGPGPSPRRHMMQGLAPHESPTPPEVPRRLGAPGGVGSSSRLMRQRFSALLASDLERQLRPQETARQRHSALVTTSMCDMSTSERVSSWLAATLAAACEPPPEDDAAALEGGAAADEPPFSRNESMERESEALSTERMSHQEQSARRLTHNGVDAAPTAPSPRPVEIRPWKSLNGGRVTLGPVNSAEEGVVERVPTPPPHPSPPTAPHGAPVRMNSQLQRVHFASGAQPPADSSDRRGEGSPRVQPPPPVG